MIENWQVDAEASTLKGLWKYRADNLYSVRQKMVETRQRNKLID